MFRSPPATESPFDMPKLIPAKPKEIETILKQNKFYLHHTTGSHKQYKNDDSGAHVTVPFHTKSIPTGTLRSIIRQSGLPTNLFRR